MTEQISIGLPMGEPTLDNKITAMRREIAMRKKVYPARIAAGRMNKQKATY